MAGYGERGMRDAIEGDPEHAGLVRDQARAVQAIAGLVDVSDGYKDTLLAVVGRVTGNRYVPLHLYQAVQLSELGTGFDSSFEKGNAQSRVREDVVLNFITGICGSRLGLRVFSDRFEWRETGPNGTHGFGSRAELAKAVDRNVDAWAGA